VTRRWAQIASTNPLERLNGEIKRRADVLGIFASRPFGSRMSGPSFGSSAR
jgi:putative transposase